jgi:nitroreductase
MNALDFAGFQGLDRAIRGRRSVRGFLPLRVNVSAVRDLIERAACAPSGTNVQPWRVYALAGEAKAALSRAIVARFMAGEKEGREFDYYPTEWKDPFTSRRREVGFGLYGLLRIGKDDKGALKARTARSVLSCDAPENRLRTSREPVESFTGFRGF